MTMLPLSTTTITVRRPQPRDDGTDPLIYDTVLTGHPAHIGAGTSGRAGVELRDGGTSSRITASLRAALLPDAVAPLTSDDRVTDEITGVDYGIEWTAVRTGLGLDHITAGLTTASGVARG